MNTKQLPFEVEVYSARGAPMGRHSDTPANFEERKTHLRRVPFVDGDYDSGGAYWGSGRGCEPLWCAWSDAGSGDSEDEFIVTYIRAGTREAAKAQLPGAKFWR